MTNDIVVFAEQRGNKLHPAAAQTVTAAAALAARSGGRVVACVIGGKIDAAADAIAAAGVAHMLTISDPSLEHYTPLRYRSALAAAIQRLSPRILLLPATFMGRDLAPRVAVRTKAALATDVVELSLRDDGRLDVRRPVYNGKAFCHVVFPAGRLAIASVRPNTFPQSAGGEATRESLAFAASPGDERQELKEILKAGGGVKDVAEADIIVSGGRSLKSEDNFNKVIYPLATALDAAVGASRAACDAGYQPHSRQVGLTGKTVTPKLYVACGISGAIQHLAGMRGSKVIVAINTDAEAPLFKVADYGIVGDLFKVVPLLTEAVQKLRQA